MEDARIRRWQRISELAIEADELRELRAAVVSVWTAPHDPAPRERLRALCAARDLHAQVVPLLAAEARASHSPLVLAVLRDEALHACKHIDRPAQRLAVLEDIAKREPDNTENLERLAWTYYLVGAWVQAASTLELLAAHVTVEHSLVILRAAGRLFRNSGRNDRALVAYRAVALHKSTDRDALIALGDLMLAPPKGPDSPFDPPPPDVQNIESKPVAESSTARIRAEGSTSPLALTNAQEPAAAHDLFASLADDEVEASLAFAFGDVEPPAQAAPRRSARQTRERDDVLRPPARPK